MSNLGLLKISIFHFCTVILKQNTCSQNGTEANTNFNYMAISISKTNSYKFWHSC